MCQTKCQSKRKCKVPCVKGTAVFVDSNRRVKLEPMDYPRLHDGKKLVDIEFIDSES